MGAFTTNLPDYTLPIMKIIGVFVSLGFGTLLVVHTTVSLAQQSVQSPNSTFLTFIILLIGVLFLFGLQMGCAFYMLHLFMKADKNKVTEKY